MQPSGSNLPGFRELQLDFAAHIRNPDANPRPDGIEARRMQIYLDLFYNNIEGFLANGFPITKKLLGSALWHQVARDFVDRHASESPYFLEISQEFLTYLELAKRADLPDFIIELCHYEWVELAL
ncbi:MAG: putative DNA-binding domain-containing protein, partial [Pseudomonadales bacterium]